jgi:hypothetical protein
MNPTFVNRIRQLPPGISASLFFFVQVILLWLPFGFKAQVGAFEEWAVLNWMQRQINPVYIFANNPTRPFNYAIFLLTSLLSPDVFLGYNIVTFALFLGRALVVYGILRQLIP